MNQPVIPWLKLTKINITLNVDKLSKHLTTSDIWKAVKSADHKTIARETNHGWMNMIYKLYSGQGETTNNSYQTAIWQGLNKRKPEHQQFPPGYTLPLFSKWRPVMSPVMSSPNTVVIPIKYTYTILILHNSINSIYINNA